MSRNPFEAPPKPPKVGSLRQPVHKNPFDDPDEEETIDFRPHNPHRPYAADVARPISAPPQSNMRSPGLSPPVPPPKRVFGGSNRPQSLPPSSTQPQSLLSKAKNQFLPSSILNGMSTSTYSRVGQPAGNNGWQPRGSELMDEPGEETVSPIRNAQTVRTQSAPSAAPQYTARAGYSFTPTSLTAATSSSGRWREQKEADLEDQDHSDEEEEGSEEDEADEDQQGVELTEAAVQPQQGRSIDPPRDARRGKKEAARKSSSTAGAAEAPSAEAGKAGKPKKTRKRKVRKTVVAVDPTDENWVVRHLLSERVYGYPHTYGGRLSNFRYYVQFNHPLLSIYFVHPLHPFTRRQRFIVFLCSLSFAVCFAFILMATPLVPVIATCQSVCNCQITSDDDASATAALFTATGSAQHFLDILPDSATDPPTPHCVGGSNDGRECSAYNTICKNYQSWMLSCLCGAITTIYDSLLRFLATCSCVQGKKRFQTNCLGVRFKALVEYFGSITLLFFSFLSAVFTLFTMVLCWYEHIAAEVLFVMVLSELWSTLQWIVWSAPWFLYKYGSDRKTFYEKLKRRSARRGEVPPV